MGYELTGTLHKSFEIQSKSDRFQTREFIVQTQENYPQLIKFQLTQDRCGILDAFKTGEVVKVFFDLRGREWNEKYFTNLQAWKIEANQPASTDQPLPPGPDMAVQFESAPAPQNQSMKAEDFDDLPF